MGFVTSAIARLQANPTLGGIIEVLKQLDNVAGTGGSGTPSTRTVVADIAALKLVNTATLLPGHEVFVLTLDDSFTLSATTLPPDVGLTGPFRVIAALGAPAGFAWVRQQLTSEVWRRVNHWYVSAAAGDDQASGSAIGAPLKTMEEIWRRNNGYFPNASTITVLNGSAAVAGPVHIVDLPAGSRGRITIEGIPTVVRTGTVVAFATEAGNTLALFTGNGDLSDGYVIRMTSGVANGNIAPILKIPGVNQANVPPNFCIPNGTGGNLQVPAPGDTYELLDPAQTASTAFGLAAEGTLKYLRAVERPEAQNFAMIGCRVDILDQDLSISVPCSGNFVACVLGSGPSPIIAGNTSTWSFLNCAFRTCVRVKDGASALLRRCVIDNSFGNLDTDTLEIGGGVGGTTTVSRWASAEIDDVGIENTFTQGLSVQLGAVRVTGTLYGTIGAIATLVQFGGKIIVDPDTGFIPTLTSLIPGSELSVDVTQQQMPDIRANAGLALPALALCNSWATLTAAPFNGKVLGVGTGSFVTTVATP